MSNFEIKIMLWFEFNKMDVDYYPPCENILATPPSAGNGFFGHRWQANSRLCYTTHNATMQIRRRNAAVIGLLSDRAQAGAAASVELMRAPWIQGARLQPEFVELFTTDLLLYFS
jgi:hypothetical protein